MKNKNRIIFDGPKDDGTYVVEFTTSEGETLAISIPRSEVHVIRHFQERVPYGITIAKKKTRGGWGCARRHPCSALSAAWFCGLAQTPLGRFGLARCETFRFPWPSASVRLFRPSYPRSEADMHYGHDSPLARVRRDKAITARTPKVAAMPAVRSPKFSGSWETP